MIKTILIVLLSFTLISCSTTKVKPLEIFSNIEPVEILHPPLPSGVRWEEVKFTVLTPEIMRELLKRLDDGELSERDLVFAAVRPNSYEHLATNIADIKRYLQDQNAVIVYYRETIPKEVYLEKED